MTPYLVQIFKAYQSPMDPDVATGYLYYFNDSLFIFFELKNAFFIFSTAVLSFLNIFATITFMSLVRFTGKRRLYLTVLSGVCISSFVIACYGFIVLPKGFHSFTIANETMPEVPSLEGSGLVYIPTIFLILW